MKKLILLLVFFISFMSFAKNGDVLAKKGFLLKENLNYKAILSKEKMADFSNQEVDCTASCYVKLSYEGSYVTTLSSTSTASDCTSASSNCLAAVRLKATIFMANYKQP